MILVLAGVALAVIAGAVVAVSTHTPRILVLALAAVLVLSPLLADPLPTPLALIARGLGAALAVYLLWIAIREQPTAAVPPIVLEGTRIGWPAVTLIAAAATVAGLGADGLGLPAQGPARAGAAGFAIAAVAVIPVITGRDILVVGGALLLLLHAVLLVRVALGGTPGPAEELLTTALLVVVAGTLAALARAAREDGDRGYAVVPDPRPRPRHVADAHPIDPA